MSAGLLLGVGVLGGIGAIARFVFDGAVSDRAGRGFPFGTLAVNLTGAFALGTLGALALGADADRLIGTGLIGAYTTFSTWALESHRLGEGGRAGLGALNLIGSLALGLAAAWLGQRLGAAL